MSSDLDKVSLAVRVQHHPSRADLLPELLARLDGLDPVVVTDPGGRPRSPWRTHRLCLESLPEDATHLLVVQDDALPCDNFVTLARSAIAERPDRIVCLFLPGTGSLLRPVNAARARGERWLELPALTFIPCVGVCYPAEIARAIPAYADAKRIPVGRADDGVVSQFARAHRLTACAPLPNLIEHLDAVPSIMGMPFGKSHAHRVSVWFLT